MKKVLALVITVVFIALIVIAAFAYQRMNENGDKMGDIYFEGTIIELNGNEAIVMPFEGEDIRGSADKISVNLSSDENFAVGDEIRVYYDGSVMESYPAQVVVEGIEKIN